MKNVWIWVTLSFYLWPLPYKCLHVLSIHNTSIFSTSTSTDLGCVFFYVHVHHKLDDQEGLDKSEKVNFRSHSIPKAYVLNVLTNVECKWWWMPYNGIHVVGHKAHIRFVFVFWICWKLHCVYFLFSAQFYNYLHCNMKATYVHYIKNEMFMFLGSARLCFWTS